MKKINTLIDEKIYANRPKNLSTEFQVFGVYLCECLGDTKNYSLYIKLAKTLPRPLLEEALSFCKEYTTAKSKPKLFMWKLKKLKEDLKARQLQNVVNDDPTNIVN